MSSSQTWYIDGKYMTHAQLLAWRDKKKATPKVEKTPEELGKEAVAKKLTEMGVPEGFSEMKAYAHEKGMVVDKTTKKKDILKFLGVA